MAYRIKDIQTEDLRRLLASMRNIADNSFVVAEGTNTKTIKTTTNTPKFYIEGQQYTKSPTDNIAMTACVSQPASMRCRYLVSIDSGGTVTITKGTQVRAYTYTAATLTMVAAEKKITDSAGGLSAFKVGDWIAISGFTDVRNNQLCVRVVGIDDIAGTWIKFGGGYPVDEALGDTVTLTVESPLPTLPAKECPMAILRITTGATAFTVGTHDLTDDIGTGSSGFTQIPYGVPSEIW